MCTTSVSNANRMPNIMVTYVAQEDGCYIIDFKGRDHGFIPLFLGFHVVVCERSKVCTTSVSNANRMPNIIVTYVAQDDGCYIIDFKGRDHGFIPPFLGFHVVV